MHTNKHYKPLFGELDSAAAPAVMSCPLSSAPTSSLSDLVSEYQVVILNLMCKWCSIVTKKGNLKQTKQKWKQGNKNKQEQNKPALQRVDGAAVNNSFGTLGVAQLLELSD